MRIYNTSNRLYTYAGGDLPPRRFTEIPKAFEKDAKVLLEKWGEELKDGGTYVEPSNAVVAEKDAEIAALKAKLSALETPPAKGKGKGPDGKEVL